MPDFSFSFRVFSNPISLNLLATFEKMFHFGESSRHLAFPYHLWLVFFSALSLLAALLPTSELTLPGSLSLLLRCLNLESDWVGYHPVVMSETLFLYCEMDTNRLLGEFSRKILAVDLIHVQHTLIRQSVHVYFYSHVGFLSKSSHLFLR